jgi:hypothetical protein
MTFSINCCKHFKCWSVCGLVACVVMVVEQLLRCHSITWKQKTISHGALVVENAARAATLRGSSPPLFLWHSGYHQPSACVIILSFNAVFVGFFRKWRTDCTIPEAVELVTSNKDVAMQILLESEGRPTSLRVVCLCKRTKGAMPFCLKRRFNKIHGQLHPMPYTRSEPSTQPWLLLFGAVRGRE